MHKFAWDSLKAYFFLSFPDTKLAGSHGHDDGMLCHFYTSQQATRDPPERLKQIIMFVRARRKCGALSCAKSPSSPPPSPGSVLWPRYLPPSPPPVPLYLSRCSRFCEMLPSKSSLHGEPFGGFCTLLYYLPSKILSRRVDAFGKLKVRHLI